MGGWDNLRGSHPNEISVISVICENQWQSLRPPSSLWPGTQMNTNRKNERKWLMRVQGITVSLDSSHPSVLPVFICVV